MITSSSSSSPPQPQQQPLLAVVVDDDDINLKENNIKKTATTTTTTCSSNNNNVNDFSSSYYLLPESEFPYKCGMKSQPGRKHHFPLSNILVNEDQIHKFHFSIYKIPAACFYLADGHGEVTRNKANWKGSRGELFMKLFKPCIERVIIKLVYDSIITSSSSEKDESSDKNVVIATTEEIILNVSHLLTKLHFELDKELKLHDTINNHNYNSGSTTTATTATSPLVLENGCTLVLGLVILGTVFFVNIGDSSMMAFDSSKTSALSIWKRHNDPFTSTCSFEDTLASYPTSLREGQSLAAVKLDYNSVKDHLKKTVTKNGCPYYKIISSRSLYGLGMTNTIGNFNHKGNLVGRNGLGRTSVYKFTLEELMIKTNRNPIIMFCSDGVKDVLNSNDFAGTLHNIELGIFNLCHKVSKCHIPDSTPIETVIDLVSNTIKDVCDDNAKDAIIDTLLKETPIDSMDYLNDVANVLVNLAILRKSYDDVSVFAIELKPIIINDDDDDERVAFSTDSSNATIIVESPQCGNHQEKVDDSNTIRNNSDKVVEGTLLCSIGNNDGASSSSSSGGGDHHHHHHQEVVVVDGNDMDVSKSILVEYPESPRLSEDLMEDIVEESLAPPPAPSSSSTTIPNVGKGLDDILTINHNNSILVDSTSSNSNSVVDYVPPSSVEKTAAGSDVDGVVVGSSSSSVCLAQTLKPPLKKLKSI